MNVNLISVDLDEPSHNWQSNIRLAISATHRRLYVYFEGKQAHEAPDVGILALLARYYNEVADLKPQLDLIPLFPFASWSLDRVAMLDDLQGILGACRVGKTRQLTQDLNHRRAGELPPVLLHPLQPDKPSLSGVTSDLLLQHKEHAELLQSYDERRDAAVRFVQQVRPGLHVQTAALRDPKEPTGAATISEMEAIVVSKETVKGADDINAWRHEHGSAPLTVVTVDLVGSQGSDLANKLSSTRLRHDEASRSAEA
ncbi:hypothetical protein WJX79_002448 [Trebouxia sp. C0005]